MLILISLIFYYELLLQNLGQGGCQAIEDAYVLNQELGSCKTRTEITSHLKKYQQRRLVRSAAVQGLSRFASDIIIRGFDTPAKIVWEDGQTFPRFENFNYAGIVTKMLQPILPIFFMVQFNFLYDGYRNESSIDLKAATGFVFIGGLILLLFAGVAGEAGLGTFIGLEAFIGAEGVIDYEAISQAVRSFFSLG
jgi:zeaxanthin epoxidase